MTGWVGTTTYVYDDNDRIISSSTESEWDQTQREMMLALAEVEADICPGCGGFLSFTTLRDHTYDASRRECQQCVMLHDVNELWDKADEQTKNGTEKWTPSARRVSIRPIPLPPEAYEHAKVQNLLGPREEG